ncbi:MAG: glycosyltransferase family 2 protein [Proteobacteria bacterium]|nr:glycosyltransferase family 2 protein [Pseudomonadota bacterium]MBU1419698.1 glycosyltransferase family 2 protein [Pseudomonadota bacterium]MBU1456445.1 glycosyltransferase family 2 protein [Pseudomonadota bacterium]
MQSLAAVQADVPLTPPLVSIIVPACNEEATVEPALRSLFQQDYPNLEVIVIDDRSTDGTYGLLTNLAQQFPEMRVEQITELPPEWLGKNHALYWGARQARGEILLFTDADIVMESSTLSRAVTFFVDEGLDHLSLIFRNVARGGLLNAMVVDALGGLFLLLRPWNVRKAGSHTFIGVGAFNMISRDGYWKLGGHAALKMHPIDDIMLGKKVKQQGLIQDCLLGGDFVQVRWYETVAEMIRGLMKNIFALYSYRVSYAAVGIFGIVVMTIVPFWGLLLAQGMAKIFFGLTVLCRFGVFLCNARGMKVRRTSLPWSLLTPYYIVYIVIKAVWITLANQGIDWRGTHYSLQELKKQEPLLTFFP